MSLKEQVEEILRIYPATRNSDVKLMLNLWLKYYPAAMLKIGDERVVKLKDLYELPREDNIKRIRAKFNEQGLYMPTNPEVIRQRKQKEVQWRQDMITF